MPSTASAWSRPWSARARASSTPSASRRSSAAPTRAPRATNTSPQKAKQLLAEAGFPNGFDIPFVAYRERHQSEALIGYLQAVGIKANLHLPAIRRHARADPRQQGGADAPDLGLVLGQRRVGGDAQLLHLRCRGHHPRPGGPRPARSRATRSVDPAVRKEAYAKALAMIAGDAPTPCRSIRCRSTTRRRRTSSSRPIRTRCPASGR